MEQNTSFEQRAPSPMSAILTTVGLVLLGGLIGSGAGLLIAKMSGYDMQALLNTFGEGSPLGERNILRYAAMANHLFMFLIPALVAGYIFYKKEWKEYFRMDAPAPAKYFLLGTLMILVAFPFAQLTYWLNTMIPLPEVLTQMENATGDMVKGLLVMNSPMELMLNLLVVAVIPAIAEEMIFRGIIQDALEKMITNPHVAILVASIIFSAIHMQFEGFLPRVVLGLVLGYLFYWTRNLWVPILAHLVNNGAQVVVAYLMPEQMAELEPGAMDSSLLLPGLISLVLTIGVGYYIVKEKVSERIAYF